MYILTVPWDLRALWSVMTVTAKFYLVCLFMSAAYSMYSLGRVEWRCRQSRKRVTPTDANESRLRQKLDFRAQSLGQLHTLLLLAFGVCCANEAFAGLRAMRYSSMSLS